MLLAIIPARGGSKGILRKNLTYLNGRPLIEYTIIAAQKSKFIDEILLSTDDDEIADIGRRLGLDVSYRRPIELAQDATSMIETLEHGLRWADTAYGGLPEATILLQPTSPLRSTKDIDAAVTVFYESSVSFLVSVNEMGEHPYECIVGSGKNWQYLVMPPSGLSRRQDYKNDFYFINGAIYLAKTTELLSRRSFINPNETYFFSMPRERSIDIDEYVDLYTAEGLIKMLNQDQ
ncbi:acylneuraminate cytidylyltransferase family protein [Polynucleobacter paneuropaeus]|jgi:N-acylneuraminate cytidylyltransferase/CMP-N,N'-diacetyllegionaminic acid synthase|uniref:acylneuraminate cytidylyltransferase family protein n=1 Tax=Polynucleobacter paneuropaeus TaxID=2527775 RepID=UPI0020442FCC|nr:acylneuraminate cytidylyltransferase family protein [Polynucleobacter paneuropaeus]